MSIDQCPVCLSRVGVMVTEGEFHHYFTFEGQLHYRVRKVTPQEPGISLSCATCFERIPMDDLCNSLQEEIMETVKKGTRRD